MPKFIFPLNYTYSYQFFGVLDSKTFLFLSGYAAILFFLLLLTPFDFFVRLAIFTILFLPIFLFFLIGFHKEPVIPFFVCLYKFYKKSKIYLYKKDCKKS